MKYKFLIAIFWLISIHANLCFAQGFVYPDFESYPPFRQMKCGLWMNYAGDIAYKTLGCRIDSTLVDGIWDLFLSIKDPPDYYMTWTYTEDSIANGMAESDYMKPLKDIIDTISFRILSPYYFEDKNHIYTRHGVSCVMSIEGWISVENVDKKTFKVFENHPTFAYDKSKCFVRGWEIKGADPKTFEPINEEYQLSRDKNYIYCYCDTMSDSEIIEMEKCLGIKLRKENKKPL